MNPRRTNTIIVDEVMYTINYTYTPGYPAEISKLPEDCYPAEPPFVEVGEVYEGFPCRDNLIKLPEESLIVAIEDELYELEEHNGN